MKTRIIMCIILPLLALTLQGQFQDNGNIFDSKSNNENVFSSHSQQDVSYRNTEQPPGGLGTVGPGEPVPIDGYIPLLLLLAAGLIIIYRRKTLNKV